MRPVKTYVRILLVFYILSRLVGCTQETKTPDEKVEDTARVQLVTILDEQLKNSLAELNSPDGATVVIKQRNDTTYCFISDLAIDQCYESFLKTPFYTDSPARFVSIVDSMGVGIFGESDFLFKKYSIVRYSSLKQKSFTEKEYDRKTSCIQLIYYKKKYIRHGFGWYKTPPLSNEQP